jgi:hypothetical protein
LSVVGNCVQHRFQIHDAPSQRQIADAHVHNNTSNRTRRVHMCACHTHNTQTHAHTHTPSTAPVPRWIGRWGSAARGSPVAHARACA